MLVKFDCQTVSKLSEVVSKRNNTRDRNSWTLESGTMVKLDFQCLDGRRNPRSVNGRIYSKAERCVP